MSRKPRDISLDYLLDLHGQVLVIDEEGGHWVKFSVHLVPVTPEKPHGLDYSLTLHEASGKRIMGFDNAHGLKGKKNVGWDHKHQFKTIKPYGYTNAASLLEDFWSAVDKILHERGVKP